MANRESSEEQNPYYSVDLRMRRGLGTCAIAFGVVATFYNDNVEALMARFPELLNVSSHIGNVGWSTAFIGAATGAVVAAYHARNPNDPNEGPNDKLVKSRGRVRALAAGIADTIGLGVNAMVETRTGLDVFSFYKDSTPSLGDLIYGTGSAAVTAALIPSFREEVFLVPIISEVSEETAVLPESEVPQPVGQV